MLRLTASQLKQALSGLSLAERHELLQLLEARDRIEAEQPQDTRPPLSHYVEQIRQECAARSPDPGAYLKACAAHEAAAAAHRERLMAERSTPEGIGARVTASLQVFSEARELAARDGFPDPDGARKEPEATKVPPEPGRRPLPRATADDIVQTRARDRTRAPPAATPAADEAEDKLAPFRDQPWMAYGPHTDD
jgi:hypothetical protein